MTTLHAHLAPLRVLVRSGFAVILWSQGILTADSQKLCLVSTSGLEVTVRDEQLEDAKDCLTEGGYIPTSQYKGDQESRLFSVNGGALFYPKGVRLRAPDAPLSAHQLATFVKLLPQSYFGLDTEDASRFEHLPQHVVAQDPANERILVPIFHTLLEGLVHIIMNPPSGVFLEGLHLRMDAKIQELVLCLARRSDEYDSDSDDDGNLDEQKECNGDAPARNNPVGKTSLDLIDESEDFDVNCCEIGFDDGYHARLPNSVKEVLQELQRELKTLEARWYMPRLYTADLSKNLAEGY